MTNAERKKRSYARLASAKRLVRIKKLFRELLEPDQAALVKWLERRKPPAKEPTAETLVKALKAAGVTEEGARRMVGKNGFD